MSDTPRTDAAWAECVRQGGKYEPFHGPLHDLARTLERESATQDARIRELEGQLKTERDAHKLAHQQWVEAREQRISAEQRLEKMEKDMRAILTIAETMAHTGANATHVIELFRANLPKALS